MKEEVLNPKRITTKPKLIVRHATTADVDEISHLSEKVYDPPYSPDILRGQINNYPEGQFVAVYQDQIIGYCATMRLPEKKALKKHTWMEITAGGYCSTHHPGGDVLYGVEIMVDPNFRGLRIGERFYRERRNLCQHYRLKGVVFGGRLPLLSRRFKKLEGNVESYIDEVKAKRIKDPVLGFQLRQGFEVIGVLKGYMPDDKESLGYAAHLMWRNPEIDPHEDTSKSHGHHLPAVVRVATVQYQQRSISSFEEFEQIVTYFVDVCSDYKTDFVVFPEFFTLQLLSIENEKVSPEIAIEKLTEYTKPIQTLFSGLAIKYNVNIIAGSHPTRTKDEIHNISFVCLRDGSVKSQPKIHPTPNESYWWNIQGGHKLSVIDTDCGPIGVLICYDVEFPELARHLIDQGANIIFVPFCTDERQAYLRVRYSAHARAIENQCYMVMSGNVGNLPKVHNMDIQYAQSCILTPCDFYFARDGIAADTTPNVEQIVFADLRLDSIFQARHSGTVLNVRDRRHDLYSVVWHKSKRL